MNSVVLFEPCFSSVNLGDYIIVEAIKREMAFLLENSFVVEQSTQTPPAPFYQMLDVRHRYPAAATYKFVCGSNLFWNSMMRIRPSWNMNIFNYHSAKGSVLVGVGSGEKRDRMDWVTRAIYRKVLNREYIHSTRDEVTKRHLESLGLKAINTGCPTMWCLSKEHCARIPTSKTNRVVFTLTDYEPDEEADKMLIHILARHYGEIYFWPQGYCDYDYLQGLGVDVKIHVLNPNIEAMHRLLQEGNIDYVGTRLHAGIFAMQHCIRSIILMIDNRAGDMKDSYNIPSVERRNAARLEELIESEWETQINLHEEQIKTWKEQFK